MSTQITITFNLLQHKSQSQPATLLNAKLNQLPMEEMMESTETTLFQTSV